MTWASVNKGSFKDWVLQDMLTEFGMDKVQWNLLSIQVDSSRNALTVDGGRER